MDHGSQDREKSGFFASRANIVLLGFLAIGGYYLVTEHRAHLVGWWPLLFVLLACPLMHFFMHGRHGGHGGSGDASDRSSDSGRNTPPHQH